MGRLHLKNNSSDNRIELALQKLSTLGIINREPGRGRPSTLFALAGGAKGAGVAH